jgi:hypothetical protein
MLTTNHVNGSVFPSPPKFQLGQGIIHRYDADLMKDGVVPAENFGVIVGIIYCDEDSIYPGWSYQIYLWKTIYQYNNRIEVEYYTDISYSSFDESEDVQSTHLINCSKLIQRVSKKQLIKYNTYNNKFDKNNGLYNLIYNAFSEDTYYSDLIETDDEKISETTSVDTSAE